MCMALVLLFINIFTPSIDFAAEAEEADEESAETADASAEDVEGIAYDSTQTRTLAEYTGQLYHIDIRVAGTFTYESSYVADDETILTVEKIWEDDNEHEELTVYLLDEEGNILLDDDGNKRYITLNEENEWKATLSTTDVYSVEEVIPDGYEVSYAYEEIESTEESDYETTGSITVNSINWVTYTDSLGDVVAVDGTYSENESESGADYEYEFFCSDRNLEDFYDTSDIEINITFTYSYVDEYGNLQSDTLTKTFDFTADYDSNTCANLTANSDDDSSNDIYDETMYGYDAVIEFELDDIITATANKAAVITNAPTENTYSLMVSKTVSGTETDDSFSFTIHIDGSELQEYQALYFSDGEEENILVTFDENGDYTISLKSDDYIIIYGISEDSEYTITETEYDCYKAYISEIQTNTANGILNNDAEIEFINEYDIEIEYDADIDIIKVFSGDSEASSSFTFLIEAQSGTNTTAEEATDKLETSSLETSVLTLTEDNNYYTSETLYSIFGSLTFTEDDVGKTFVYTISEVSPDDIEDGYVYDEKIYTASFTVLLDDDELYITKLITDSSGNTVDEIVFYNEYSTPYGFLLITKTVELGEGADEAPDDAFTFTIEAYLSDGTALNGTYGEYTFENGFLTVSIKAGEQILIEGLPDGDTYTITEEDCSNYTTTVNGEEGTQTEGTISKGETDEVSYVNTYLLVGLIIQKVGDSENGVEGAVYELVDSEGNVVAEVTTDENGYSEVLYLTPGTYTLTEIYAPEGYYIDGDTYTIYLSEDNLGTTITYTVMDVVIEILPNAGSNMFFIYAGVCIVLFGLLVLLAKRSRRIAESKNKIYN